MDESLLEGIPPSQASGDFPRQTSSCDPALCYSSISPDQATPLKWSIPSDQFPDDLLVHDNSALKSFTTTHYARVYPVFPRDSTKFPNGKRGRMRKWFDVAALSRNVAHLHLNSADTLASDAQIAVLRAPLSLPHGPEDASLVSVVAKVAHHTCGAHHRLLVEAELFNIISPLVEEKLEGGENVNIPRFYGLYLPVRKDGSTRFRSHGEGCNEDCRQEVLWKTPILLLEECAETVVTD